MNYEYKVVLNYIEKGINVKMDQCINVFTEYIESALRDTENITELIELEKKIISLVKKELVWGIEIELQVSEYEDFSPRKAIKLIRYSKYKERLELLNVNNSNLEYTNKDMEIKEMLKLLKSDFKSCKLELKNIVKEIVLNKLKEAV